MPECERGRNVDIYLSPPPCLKKIRVIFVLVAGKAPAPVPPPNIYASTKSAGTVLVRRDARPTLSNAHSHACVCVGGQSSTMEIGQNIHDGLSTYQCCRI